MNPFPLPLVALGAGSQVEEQALDYLDMPKEMQTYAPPRPDAVADPALRAAACRQLERLLARMKAWRFGAPNPPRLDLAPLPPELRGVINELLGEGEVSLIVRGQPELRIQETVFAGIWRVVGVDAGQGIVSDQVCACDLPAEVVAGARAAARPSVPIGAPPEGVMNAPPVLAELLDRSAAYRDGVPAHIVNLTLLPMTPADHAHLAQVLGPGSVTVLSRGYGNCRVSSTGLADTWWVQYFNSVDTVILSTIEVTAVPDVVPAAAEDFADSIDRLEEWIMTLKEWGEQ